MRIRIGKPAQSRKTHGERDADYKEPTIEERIGATRIMGYIGAALIAGFLLTIAYPVYENAKTISVDGTVLSVSSDTSRQSGRSDNSGRTVYSHKFQYTDAEGVEHIGDTTGDGGDTSYRVGEVVSIGYYSDDFSKVRIHSWFGLWKIQLTLLGLGIALIWFSVAAIKQIREEAKALD